MKITKNIFLILIGLGFGMFLGYFIKDQLTDRCPPTTVNQVSIKKPKSKGGGTLSLESILGVDTEIEEPEKKRRRRRTKK